VDAESRFVFGVRAEVARILVYSEDEVFATFLIYLCEFDFGDVDDAGSTDVVA